MLLPPGGTPRRSAVEVGATAASAGAASVGVTAVGDVAAAGVTVVGDVAAAGAIAAGAGATAAGGEPHPPGGCRLASPLEQAKLAPRKQIHADLTAVRPAWILRAGLRVAVWPQRPFGDDAELTSEVCRRRRNSSHLPGGVLVAVRLLGRRTTLWRTRRNPGRRASTARLDWSEEKSKPGSNGRVTVSWRELSVDQDISMSVKALP
jgi:hypothetical protein